MNAPRWIRLTGTDSIARREGRAVAIGGWELAVFNLGDRYLALENRCPHAGGPLSDGIVSGCTVVCPLHAWRVRLDTGGVERPAGASACVRTFPTRVEGDIVLVELPAQTLAPDGTGRAA